MTFPRKKVLFLLSLSLFFCLGTLYLFYLKSGRPYLTVIGPVKMADGIGRQSVELIDTLKEDVQIGFIPTQKVNLSDVPQEVIPFLEPNKKLGHVIIYEESLPVPNHNIKKKLNKTLKTPKKNDQIRIAYSMYEYSSIPPLWAEALNSYFDAVAVPDEFLVEVYQKSGVKIPIFTLPLGLKMEHFLSEPLKEKAHTPFCFINTSSMIPRKNHEGLILAFNKAFGNDPSVLLLLNYRYTAADALEKTKQLIETVGATNIILENKQLDKKNYLDFFSRGDVFISLAKGEGFSIQPREAMAFGLPVIISDNTAHKTILKSGLACGVACCGTEQAYNPFLKCECGEEWIVDIDEAVEKMKEIYQNYSNYLKTSSARRKWAAVYSFDNLKPYYLNLIKPSTIQLGKENIVTLECLTTSSEELYKKYKRLIGASKPN